MSLHQGFNKANLHVRRELTVLERLAENYGEAMVLEIQAKQEQGYIPFSSLADNSQLEPWEIEELREAQILKAREERKSRFEQYARAGLKKIDGPYPSSVLDTSLLYFVQKHHTWLLVNELFQLLGIPNRDKPRVLRGITSTHIRNVPEGTPGISSAQLLITLEGAEKAASLYHQQELFNTVRQAVTIKKENYDTSIQYAPEDVSGLKEFAQANPTLTAAQETVTDDEHSRGMLSLQVANGEVQETSRHTGTLSIKASDFIVPDGTLLSTAKTPLGLPATTLKESTLVTYLGMDIDLRTAETMGLVKKVNGEYVEVEGANTAPIGTGMEDEPQTDSDAEAYISDEFENTLGSLASSIPMQVLDATITASSQREAKA